MRVLELINRENYLDTLDYLDSQERIKQCCTESINRKRAYLRHFLEYACSSSFTDLEKIQLTFPNYLEKARNDNKEKRLSPYTIKRTLREIREFYQWARLYKSRKYNKVPQVWIDTLIISKIRMNRVGLQDREYYSLEDTIKLCSFEPEALIDERDRAAIAMLYLSSMRVSALTSIKISNIHIDEMTIIQNPEEGVKTKNGKSMQTILLPIQILLDVCMKWYTKLLDELGPDAYWYPVLSSDGLRFDTKKTIGQVDSRNKSLRDGVIRLCKRAGIKYLSPHKFRRGHGVYAVKHSENFEEFQAYSQNMGHEDPGTTYKFYSKLSNNDIKQIILKNR